MKYIKTFEDNIIDDVITHKQIKECSNIIQKNSGINRYNGFEDWLTHNWCFDHDPNKDFFCTYNFHLLNNSDSIKLLKKYLTDNNINFEYKNDTFKKTIKVIEFKLEKEDILYYLIKDQHPSLTDKEIESKIDDILEDERMKKASKKYNI